MATAALEPGDKAPVEMTGNWWLGVLLIFYGVDLLVCTVVNFMGYFHGLYWILFTEIFLALFAALFVVVIWRSVKPLFLFSGLKWQKILVYGLAAILFAVFVNMIINWVNRTVFHQDVYYYRSFRHLEYPRLGMVLIVAVIPAIFEEFAYRGVILQCLFKIADDRQAILLGAIMFAIIHMSFISFFWLVPFAIWLGNVRKNEKTIWYGVIIHFCFNITACLFEFYELKLI